VSRALLTRKTQYGVADFEVAKTYVLQRQVELNEFTDRYEDLVEVLCSAAQFGPSPKLDAVYTDLRRIYDVQYASLRPFLISYLEFVPNDEQGGLKLCGRPLDAFEAIVAATDLHELIRQDDGSMISRINRTREALARYGEHLRLLAARMV